MGMSGISNLLNKELMDQVCALSDGTFFAIKVLTDNDDHRDEIKFCRDVAALLARSKRTSSPYLRYLSLERDLAVLARRFHGTVYSVSSDGVVRRHPSP
jgi:hypothetical protein